jgi:serine/threonine protein kinase
MGESFELIDKYVVVDYLGSGAYGCVCAALDVSSGCTGGVPADYPPANPSGARTDTMVAIKKCKLIFQSRTLAKRTLREIRLLRHLSHPNIIDLKRVLMPRHAATFNDMYLVFEMMETDLASIIRSQQPLTDSHVRHFIMQLLQACEYLHQNCVVHRDIKPRNILVNGDCSLRLADFGLSRTHSKLQDSRTVAMTEYVTTRWYRAPEILVGWGLYGSPIDMWAVGCVLCELVGRRPIFPGGDSKTQYVCCG